jgi:hypothetical protein
MFFINPAGFMLLTDVSGFLEKKKKKLLEEKKESRLF